MSKPKTICVFGDSTAWGAWDMEKGGWVNRLWFRVGKRKENDDLTLIYNCSVSGGTTDDTLRRFEGESKERRADAFIFQCGLNDSAYQTKPDNYLVPLEKFKENLTEIIRRAKKITDKIIFLSIRRCDESRTTPVSWIDVYYTNENVEKYNAVIKNICQENNVLFLNLNPLDNSDFDDGLHPKAQGHEKIFQQVKDFLVTNKWID